MLPSHQYYVMMGRIDFQEKLKPSDKLYVQIGNRDFTDAPRDFFAVAMQFQNILSFGDAIRILESFGKDAAMELYKLQKERRIIEISVSPTDSELKFPSDLTVVPTASSKVISGQRVLTSQNKQTTVEISHLMFELLYQRSKDSLEQRIHKIARKYTYSHDRIHLELAKCLPILIAGKFAYFSIKDTDSLRSFTQPHKGKRFGHSNFGIDVDFGDLVGDVFGGVFDNIDI